MSILDWAIAIIPMIFVLYMGFYSRRYIKGVTDYLAAGRVAGRYVLSVGSVATGLAVLTLIGFVEVNYRTGLAMTYWNSILLPLSVIMALSGFVIYRFRETKCLSMGQFLELRYNRSLRIYASILRSIAELLANCMCPALAARFMIYYIGLPQQFELFGFQIPTFMILTLFLISMCVLICWLGGGLSLMITDTIQGFLCYPLLMIFFLFIISKISWSDMVVPVMMDRVPGESFLDPYDVKALRDFNVFALLVTIYSSIINRGNWIGSSSEMSARSPHEQKMANIMGAWRGMFGDVLYLLLALLIIVVMSHNSFAPTAKNIRDDLSGKVLDEVCYDDPNVLKQINSELAAMPPRSHEIGRDAHLSHENNLDTAHLDVVHQRLKQGDIENGEEKFQEFNTLYHQMMLPVTLKNMLPEGMIGLFALFVLLMMLSTDDSRLFSSSMTIAQDCILPFMKKGIAPEKHILIIRLTALGCGIFWFFTSFFMAQLDYVNMFVTIMCSLWVGAGPMIIFGLYSRFGNTTGAFASLLSGMILALGFIFLQRNWADVCYPFLEEHGYVEMVAAFLETCSAPFEPLIVWRMSAHKFPINSMEINFIIMIFCLAAFLIGSWVTYKKPFNLDRILHRGIYDTDGDKPEKFKWSFRNVCKSLLGITPEFTTGDKVISWSIFIYTFIFKFVICFVLVLIWNIFSPWHPDWWGHYFYITALLIPCIAAFITTFWFIIGGIIDMRRLFRDLNARVNDPLDNGQVSGEVSLADEKRFAEIEKLQNEKVKNSTMS